jgi:hypothetical protein
MNPAARCTGLLPRRGASHSSSAREFGATARTCGMSRNEVVWDRAASVGQAVAAAANHDRDTYLGSSPVWVRCSATSVSLRFMCWDTRRNRSNASPADMR